MSEKNWLNESMVSLVSRRYMRGENGTESLVVCLSEYLPFRAVYSFGCGAVVSSSWWNSYIFWVKATYQEKVAINLNPEVDVGGGGGGVQHTLNNCGQIFYKHTHTHLLFKQLLDLPLVTLLI